MEFDNSLPIYSQIVELFKRRIAAGEYKPGDKVAAVRELAVELGVNPNTMQKALAMLEQDGLLRTERTSGRYVTNDAQQIAALKLSLLELEATRFAKAVSALGCKKSDALEALGRILS